MKPISKQAQKVMERLTENMNEENRHRVFSAEIEGIMDVVVEMISVPDYDELPQYSIAHYYEQYGDLMRDPEMVFMKGPDGRFYPIYYRQDNLGIEEFSVEMENGKPARVSPRMQAGQAVFANMWMRNIQEQQGLR